MKIQTLLIPILASSALFGCEQVSSERQTKEWNNGVPHAAYGGDKPASGDSLWFVETGPDGHDYTVRTGNSYGGGSGIAHSPNCAVCVNNPDKFR